MAQQSLPAARLDFVSDDTLAALPEFLAARRVWAERVWPLQDDRPEVRLAGVVVDLVEPVELERLFFAVLLVMVEDDRLEAQRVVSGWSRHSPFEVA